MLKIELDELALETKFIEELQKRLDAIQYRCTLWDMKELIRQTNMSEPFIKEKFFYHPDFPKFKVGNKWFFPARETESFILNWIKKYNSMNKTGS